MDLAALGGAILHIAQPWTLFMLFIGTLIGIVVGAIPGLSGAMLIALTQPLTFYMQPFDAVVLPIVMMFCVIGSYALNNTMFDVWVMLGFGVVGFLLEKARIPLGPFVIGFVLAPLAEEKRRSGLMMTAGDFTPIFTRPFPLAFALIPLTLLLWPIIGDWRRKRSGS